MLRDGLSLFTVAAVLPLAVQARLEQLPPATSAANAVLTEAESASPPAAVSGGMGKRIKRAADGMFYVTAYINGRPLRLLVDTGASMLVLSNRDARAIGIADADLAYDDRVRTVAGAARMARVSIDRISIAGRDLDHVDAAVLADGSGVSLLGHNALAYFDSISIEGDQLILR